MTSSRLVTSVQSKLYVVKTTNSLSNILTYYYVTVFDVIRTSLLRHVPVGVIQLEYSRRLEVSAMADYVLGTRIARLSAAVICWGE